MTRAARNSFVDLSLSLVVLSFSGGIGGLEHAYGKRHLVRIGIIAVVTDLSNLPPQVSRSAFAEHNVALNFGLKGLNVVEHHGESDETRRHGHCTQGCRNEGDQAQVVRPLHLQNFFVFSHGYGFVEIGRAHV